MKYPMVIILRLEKYIEVDNFLEDNKELLNFTPFIVELDNKSNELNKLWNENYHILLTYGKEDEYIKYVNSIITDRMFSRWIHKNELSTIENWNNSVNHCYINYIIKDIHLTRPIFSIFTTCYNSFKKIDRVYESIKNQYFKDWEWVIMDDSPNDDHFNSLREKFDNDSRIRLYRRSKNSGSIGNVKNEVVSLCRGKYVIELDHDDELLPHTLSDSVRAFNENEDVGFIYMDFTNIYENGKNFHYGDLFSLGYAGYYIQKLNNKWVFVHNTANINNVTLFRIVSIPNHPRIWRKDFLMKIGNYSEYLPICDDQELLMRTAINTKIIKIAKIGYIQYMNDGGNNFSLIRNSEINRLGKNFIVPQFYKMYNVDEKMKELDAYEDDIYKYKHDNIWKRKNYTHKYCNKVLQYDYDKQYCILGVDTLYKNLERINELYSNKRNDFLLCQSNGTLIDISKILDDNKLDRFKFHVMKDTTNKEFINFFNMCYRSCDDFEIIN